MPNNTKNSSQKPIYTGIFDTYIDNIRCHVYYPTNDKNEFASEKQDLRVIKDMEIVIQCVTVWLRVFMTRISKIFAWPLVVKLLTNTMIKLFYVEKFNYYKYNTWAKSIPYEIQSCMTGYKFTEEGADGNKNRTPDFDKLKKMANAPHIQRAVIYHIGVAGTIDSSYNNICRRLAVELNALVIVPSFNCGTQMISWDRENSKMVPYSFHVPMYTNNQARKDQNDLRSEYTYRVATVLKSLTTVYANDPGIKISAIGHSFGGCSVFHLLANTKGPEYVSYVFESIVSLGGSIAVGITDLDWRQILENEYDTKVLQIHEDMYLKDPRQKSVYSRSFLNKNNKRDTDDQKHWIITIKNCQHSDVFDGNHEKLERQQAARKKSLTRFFIPDLHKIIAEFLHTYPYRGNARDGYENQIEATCSFVNGSDMSEYLEGGNNFFIEGVPDAHEVDEERVAASVERLLGTK